MLTIKIDLLKNHPDSIPGCAKIWHEGLGKIWMPDIDIHEVESLFYEELNHETPLTYIALCDQTLVGSCTFQLKDDIRPDLGPWIESVVVDPNYQKQGIGKMLLDATINKAKSLGFEQLYLFAFDSKIADYYSRLGWVNIGMNEFKGHRVTIMEINLKSKDV